MNLPFGLSLKKIEAIPSDILNGAQGAYNDIFSSGNNSAPAGANNGGYRAPVMSQPVPVNPQANVPGMAPPNISFLTNPQPGQAPPGMKRDANGNLVPDYGGAGPNPNDPLGNFLTKYVGRPAAFIGKNAGSVPYNASREVIDTAMGNKTAANNANTALLNNSSNLIDVARGFVTRPIGEAILTVDPGLAHGQPGDFKDQQQTYTPPNGIARDVFGSQPMQNIQKKTANNYATHAYLPGYERGPLAAGEALGSVAQTVPGVGAVVKAIKGADTIAKADNKLQAVSDLTKPNPQKIAVRAQQLQNTVDNVRDLPSNVMKATAGGVKLTGSAVKSATQAVADNYKAYGEPTGGFASTKTTPVSLSDIPRLGMPPSPPSTEPIATAVAPSNTGMPAVDKAFDDVAKEQSTKGDYASSKDATELVNRAGGYSAVGQRVANALRNALGKNLSKDEQVQVTKLLDGQTVPATEKAIKVAQQARELHDQGIQIRQAIKPELGKVTNYVPRYVKNLVVSSAKTATQSPGAILSKVRNLSDLFDQDSMSSNSRIEGKFQAADGAAVYGSPKQLGFTAHKDGTFTDKDGKEFNRQSVSNTEMEANTPRKYVWNYNQIAGMHHADTLSLKARAEALAELQRDPHKYGIYTKEEVDAGLVKPQDVTEIRGINELNKDAEGKAQTLYASGKTAKTLRDEFGSGNPGSLAAKLAGKAYDIPSHIVTQFIVLNPFFHGMNQLYQTAIAAGNIPGGLTGWSKTAVGIAKIGEDDIRDYLRAGGHIPDYGSSRSNWLSKLTLGTTKLNSKAMSGIELRLRVGLFKASKDSNMSDAAAIRNIDRFLGDDRHMNTAMQRTMLFAHYFRTMTGAIGSQVRHPIENAGANANTVALAAITAAVSQGYKEFTGNPNAHARIPGEIGLANEVYNIGKDAASGDYNGAVGQAANRVNPLLKEGVQQATNHDFFTQGKVSDTTPVSVGKTRLSPQQTHAVNSLLAPAQVVERGASGKRSVTEIAANQLGINVPHARGYQAAPSGNADFLNTKKAIKDSTGNDPTGYQQQQAYFKNLTALKSQFSNDKTSTDDLNKYFDRNHDPVTGQVISMSPADRLETAGALATNDRLRQAIASFERQQPNHDPKWDLPDQQLAYKMTYDAMLEGSPERTYMRAQATGANGQNWLDNLTNQQNAYYNQLKQSQPPGSQPPEPSGPKYPLDDQQSALMSRYDQATVAQKEDMIKNPSLGPELTVAWNLQAKWNNAMRQAATGRDTPLLKSYPEAPPGVQQIIDTYNAIPKGGGKYGGSIYRAQWIKNHPQENAQMQNYLSQTTLFGLEKDASVDRFQGSTPSQQELKDIKNVGQYDISTKKNNDGSTSYALGSPPPGYVSDSSGSGGFSSKSNDLLHKVLADVKQAAQSRDAEHAQKAAKNTVKRAIQSGNVHPPRRLNVKMRGETHVKPYKVKTATLKARRVYAVAPQKSNSLVKSNHVKLKT